MWAGQQNNGLISKGGIIDYVIIKLASFPDLNPIATIWSSKKVKPK
jgi:hypothetical protein